MEDTKNDKLFPRMCPRFPMTTHACTRFTLLLTQSGTIWTKSGAQKIAEFQDTIGGSATAYNAFMRRKKVKTVDKAKAESHLLDVPADVKLPGEKQGDVPVYEKCDTMRRQICTLIKKDGVTQAAYPRAICQVHPRRARHTAQGPEGFPGPSWARDRVY